MDSITHNCFLFSNIQQDDTLKFVGNKFTNVPVSTLGLTGATGSQGIQGIQGIQGDTGATGSFQAETVANTNGTDITATTTTSGGVVTISTISNPPAGTYLITSSFSARSPTSTQPLYCDIRLNGTLEQRAGIELTTTYQNLNNHAILTVNGTDDITLTVFEGTATLLKEIICIKLILLRIG